VLTLGYHSDMSVLRKAYKWAFRSKSNKKLLSALQWATREFSVIHCTIDPSLDQATGLSCISGQCRCTQKQRFDESEFELNIAGCFCK